ncbi:chaperone NapD [Azohydromonas aeria]|uniref:chaperone NapD n=1 Tax=Azohydromonas aeria TaxID=2590212 RepID=UPI0012FC879D|nr:chaperone NapD [Azohydromonas aeria]
MTAPPAQSPAREREVHIAGVLVQARAEAVARLRGDIAAQPGATLAQWAPDGRLVVVLEHEGGAAMVQALSALRDLPGVLNVALVYQHAEPWEALQQEMP